MLGSGIAAAVVLLTFCLVLLPAAYGSVGAAAFPGLVAALWAAWLYRLPGRVDRAKFLHPRARTFQLDARQAALRIKESLESATVSYGEPWQCLVQDPVGGRLVFAIDWIDKKVQGLSGHFVKVEQRTVRLERRLTLQVAIEEPMSGCAMVQLHWCPSAPGNPAACDHVIRATSTEIDRCLGVGVPAPRRRSNWVEPPSWALIAVTAVMLSILSIDVFGYLGRIEAERRERAEAAARARVEFARRGSQMRCEIAEWQKFKRVSGI